MEKIIKSLIKIIGKEYVITPGMAEYHAYTFSDATLYRSKPDIIVYAAARGMVSFTVIKPFVEEMIPWTKQMNCPAYIKVEIGKLIELIVRENNS